MQTKRTNSLARKFLKLILRLSAGVLVIAGCALLFFCLAVWLEARRYQSEQSQAFSAALDRQAVTAENGAEATARPAQPSPPAAPRIHPGSVLGRLEIRRLGVSVMFAEGDGEPTLRHAVGHLPGTALPGQAGNVVLAGHRDTFFRPLRHIRRGDNITLRTLHGSYRYRVDQIEIVKPSDTAVLASTKSPELTLVTCYPFHFIGHAPKRFIVRAELRSQAS
ncbi:MAG TPA: class D sortase [Bryobacteraceae bacterium]|nr:class D sortase [Bryobacteraceae bacterium]